MFRRRTQKPIPAPPLEETADPELRAECTRLALRIRRARLRAIGFLPASPEVGALPAAVQVAFQLARASGEPVGVVDANGRWPAFPPSEEPTDEQVFLTRWLMDREGGGRLEVEAPRVALLLPLRPTGAGNAIPQVEWVLREAAPSFAHLLVDLTGFQEIGEYLTAVALVDGAVVVARAGVTREMDLLHLQHALPPERNLGVVFVGGQSAG